MATINMENTTPTGDIKKIDLKHAAVRVQPVILDTPSLTPAATPEETSPAGEDQMVGKKMFSIEQPDDKAGELAAKLTLEEQVRILECCRKSLNTTVAGSVVYHIHTMLLR
jgi:beta-glucosidase